MNKLKSPLPSLPNNLDETSLYLYAIIDCAHFDACFYKMFIKNKHVECQSLLAKTPYKKSVEASPILIRIDESNPLCTNVINEVLFAQIDKPSVVWFWSALPFTTIQNNLTELMFVEKEDGRLIFLRYYDPRCLKDLLQALNTDPQALKYLQQIKFWAFYLDGRYHYITDSQGI